MDEGKKKARLDAATSRPAKGYDSVRHVPMYDSIMGGMENQVFSEGVS